MVLRGFSEVYGFWKTYCTRLSMSFGRCRALCARSAPANVISPAQSRCSPTMQRASVVLPEPDSPTTARQDSAGTSSPTLNSTWLAP